MILRAPAKLNLCLHVGRRREDGLHELRSLFCPLTLSDRIEIGDAAGEGDEVVCPLIEGPNLVAVALEALRARGWAPPPLQVEIDKRIPVAAGLGGGSADAAALLRLAAPAIDGVDELAAALGADVPSQIEPEFAMVSGAGEVVAPLGDPGEVGFVLIPDQTGLATADVYAEADRLGIGRSGEELDELGRRLRDAVAAARSPLDYVDLLVNDLENAALSLRPEISEALAALEEIGAAKAMITGSGPTAFGIFRDLPHADAAASALPPRYAGAIVTTASRMPTG